MKEIKRIRLYNIPVDVLTVQETLNLVVDAIQEKKLIHHTVINAGKISLMQSDPELYKSVVEADIINADGMPVVWASRLVGRPLPERVNGTNLMESLVDLAHKNGYKIFFFGAKEEIVKGVVDHYSKKYSPAVVAGYRNGYFGPNDEANIARQIRDSGAHILFVAISSPIKENFLYRHKEILNSLNFVMGVGGSFDVVAGLVSRAPVWMQNAGLEWFYRFLQEPRRMFRRYTVGNAHFIWLTMKEFYRIRILKQAD
ncbi:MAG: WecB/TagA/CpsF family glycosyltransferase [Cyclobacteriaceae bacterium]|mgnify:CR=1 FL=1|nr:WecB/TagA/CpsF family glycosyltransferase [Cyclobacteriaceae bacterium]